MAGQLLVGAQNLEFGCAPLVLPGFQSFSPNQLVILTFSGTGKPVQQTTTTTTIHTLALVAGTLIKQNFGSGFSLNFRVDS